MKANQFLKAYGLKRVRHLLTMSSNAIVYCLDGEHVHVDDLKRLVESHELVEKLGGLENAKGEYFSCVKNNEPASHIARALQDVESCM